MNFNSMVFYATMIDIRDNESAFTLFVDFEALYLAMREESSRPVEAAITLLGSVKRWLIEEKGLNFVLGRAYAAWDYPASREALGSLSMLSMSPQYLMARRPRSSACIKMSLDLMEVLLTRPEIGNFVMVVTDREYLPIIERIREQAAEAWLFVPGVTNLSELRELVDREHCMDALHFLPEELRDQMGRTSDYDIGDYEVDEDDLKRCAELLLLARERLQSDDIWLVPFLKEYMNREFEELNNAKRKAIIAEMEERKAITIENRENKYGPGTFSVIVAGWDNELFRQAEEEG